MWEFMSATKKRDAFSNCHPLINFYYFLLVIACGMVFLQPILMIMSFTCGLIYAIYLNGKRAVRFTLFGVLPMFLVAAIFNPLFSHSGITILTYLPNGNPVTLESVLYGLAMGGMLATVITWFACFNQIMTADKLTYLFGKITPALALIFSMTLRLVPRFKSQIKVIINGQKCIGKGVETGNILTRAKNGILVISILITWALENGVETAHSMKSRGYGLAGRTHFWLFRFEKRDYLLLILLILSTVGLLVGSLSGVLAIQFFPWIIMPPVSLGTVLIYAMFLVLLNLPMILNIGEDLKWKSIKSTL